MSRCYIVIKRLAHSTCTCIVLVLAQRLSSVWEKVYPLGCGPQKWTTKSLFWKYLVKNRGPTNSAPPYEECLYTMKRSIIIFICKHFYVAYRNYIAYLAIFHQKNKNTIEHCLFSRVSIITWSTAGIAFATKERAHAEGWLTDESKCCVRPPKVSFLSRVGEQVRGLGGGEAAMCQRAR